MGIINIPIFWATRILILALLLPLTSNHVNAGSLVQKSIIEISTLPQTFSMTPYVDAKGEWLYIHPLKGGEEKVFSIRDGRVVSNPSSTIFGGQRLGSISPLDVLAAPQSPRFNYLYRLGCSSHNRGCTVLDDDSRLIFTSFEKSTSKVIVETIYIEPLLDHFSMLLSGEITSGSSIFDDIDLSILDYAIRFTPYREKLIDSIHSINNLARLENFQNTRRALDLCNWPAFTCADKANVFIDLRREEEQRLIRIYAFEIGKKFLAQRGKPNPQALIDFLMKISAPPFPAGDASAYAIDELSKFSLADRKRMSQGLLTAATGNTTIHCFSAWLTENNCPTATENMPGSEQLHQGTQQRQAAPPREHLSSTTPLSNNIPEEWRKISTHQDKLQLLAIDESSGKLIRDNKTIGGVVFVARAIGAISEGKFEIFAKPNSNSPIPLLYGSYRVKLELGLNYVREDSCVGAIRCLLGNNERIAKTGSRTVTFTLHPGNNWSETKTVYFGHLLPLTADGGNRYRSSLRDLRLAAKGINWTLD